MGRAPAKTASGTETRLELPKLNVQHATILLIGDSPLICHAWSEKARQQMRDKQFGLATPGREKKDPVQDFVESLYQLDPDGRFEMEGKEIISGSWGFPAIAFKAAGVAACTSIGGITKVSARQAFHVFGEKTNYVGLTSFSGEFVRIQGSQPKIREDMVRINNQSADLRYRGEFWPWYVYLNIRYNANVLSLEQIANLMNTGGFACGIGDWRPERDGQSGMFHVGSEHEIADLTIPEPVARMKPARKADGVPLRAKPRSNGRETRA